MEKGRERTGGEMSGGEGRGGEGKRGKEKRGEGKREEKGEGRRRDRLPFRKFLDPPRVITAGKRVRAELSARIGFQRTMYTY